MALTFNIDGTNRSGVLSLRFGSGTAKSANPQRPTMALGAGRLLIDGYRTTDRKKLIVREGTTKLVECWLQNEQYNEVTGYSEYDLEGLLARAGQAQVEVSQNSATANANQAAVLNLMRNAFGLMAMQSSVASTPLADYTFEGPAAGYASSFGQVSGGLPYVTNVGLLGLRSPFRVPNTLAGTFGERDYRISQLVTEFDQGQLWNKALIQYDGPETPGSGTGTGSVTDPGAGGASGVVTGLTIANPASGVKIEDMAATLTVGAATGSWREVDGDPGSGNASGTVTDPGQSDLRGVDTNLTLNDPVTGHVIEELDATLTVGAATGTWREVEGDPGSGTGAGTVTDPGAFGASGVRTNLAIANPDANHRIEDMAATLTVGAASGATYTLDNVTRQVGPSEGSAAISNVNGVSLIRVTLNSGERIESATVTGNIARIVQISTGNNIRSTPVAASFVVGSFSTGVIDVGLGGPTAQVTAQGVQCTYYTNSTWSATISGQTITYALGYRNDSGNLLQLQLVSDGALRLGNVEVVVSVTVSYVVSNSTVFTLPAPTRRTAPSWEVERVSRSQNPNNRNNSLARVTLVGTDQPGTWRLNDGGTNVDVSSWEHSTGGKTYRLGGIAVSFAITWKLRDTRTHTVTPSRLQAPSWEVERVSRSTDPTNRNRKFVRVTVANAHEPGRWRINDGTNSVDLSGWSHTANRREYRITGIGVSFAVTWRTRDTRTHTVTPTRRTAPNWDVDRVGLTDNPANANNRLVRVTVLGTNSPGTWRINDGTHTVDLTTWERTANRREYKLLTIAVSFAVTWILDDENIYTLEAQNDDSIAVWGERTLTFPVWFRRTATAALQARIDALAVPRNIRTVDFYLDQRDATKNAEIAALQPGQYIALPHVGSIVYIMHSEITWSSGRGGIKRLTCIDTGESHTPTIPTNALRWMDDPIEWQNDYLEWTVT